MKLDTPFVYYSIVGNFLYCTYKKDVNIDLLISKEIVQVRLAFMKGKRMPSVINSEGLVSMDKPAREYLASEAGTEGLIASAIIVQSSFSSVLTNFFLSVNKTKMPVKSFTDFISAQKWLEQYINQ